MTPEKPVLKPEDQKGTNTRPGAKNAREAAFSALQRVFRDKSFLSDVLPEETEGLSVRDRAFVRRLSYGVLERKISLDLVIASFSSAPLKKIKPKLLVILEIAAYELLYTDAVSYAAVNEAVALAKRKGYAALSGFVNAVLRAVSRDGKAYLEKLDPWEKAGVPPFLKEKLTLWYGEEKGLAIAEEALRESDETVVRRNRFFASEEDFLSALAAEGFTARKTGFSADTWYVKGESPVFSTESFKKGLFYIQELGSCLAGDAVRDLAEKAGELCGRTEEPGAVFTVFDAASSPGGKLFHFLDLALTLSHKKIRAVASDLTEARTSLIAENLWRMPYPNVEIRTGDAAVFQPEYREAFDLVIADLPCSGLGTLSKNPELRLRTTEESLWEIAALQQRILDNICLYVKPGGTIAYSTCTLNPEENTGNVRRFLAAHPDFSLVPFTENLPEPLKCAEGGRGELQLLPDDYPGEGFYIARLQKAE